VADAPAAERQGEAAAFLERLRDPDIQVRLNAAVRLAYLGRAEGLAELLEGLAHESGSIRFHQVPDALALLGSAGDERLSQLVRQPGPARLGAARALMLRGRLRGVPEAVAALLGAPDHTTRWWATALAGEIGPAAGPAADALRRMLQESGPEFALGAQALAAIAGPDALPALRQELEHPTAPRRIAAMRGLSGLGRRRSGRLRGC
jgi:HEAT repeat protein